MVSSHYHGTGKWHESVTTESRHGALGVFCYLFQPEIGHRSQSSDLTEAELALCFGDSRARTSVRPLPSIVSIGARADRKLWNASHLDVCLGRSRIASAPADCGPPGNRLRADHDDGRDLGGWGRHASFRKRLA